MAKLLYSMGEVTEMFDVNASLIRYWESKFDCIRPRKNKKGNRLFTPEDVENLKLIYHLVKEKGMTLEGANRTMKNHRRAVAGDASLLERLQKIRAMLVEVRESLKDDGKAAYVQPDEPVDMPEPVMGHEEMPVPDDVANVSAAAAAEQGQPADDAVADDTVADDVLLPETAAVEEIAAGEPAVEEKTAAGEPAAEDSVVDESAAAESDTAVPVEAEPAEEKPAGAKRARSSAPKRRRRKSDEEKELFPFYEQSLF
ncbi:MAG: MerR family transcriptional regulator [Alistipes sp.]|nr:MerR family transcriptional regulator [Alistipes sp.]